MLEHYLHIEFDPERTLQDQVREHLVDLILSGCLPVDKALPSSRRLASMLGISRNTVVLIYESLVDNGFIESRPRKGYFVTNTYQVSEAIGTKAVHTDSSTSLNWHQRFKKHPSDQPNIVKPNNWLGFEYPLSMDRYSMSFSR